MDIKTKKQRSYNMSRVKSKNTKPELLMFSLLKKSGYKFKRHYAILGKPDIVFPRHKIAVFINGEFWHGRNYKSLKTSIPEFWVKKIGINIKRDKSVQRKLHNAGWHIINFWGRNVMSRPDYSFRKLKSFLEKHEGFASKGK